MHVCCIYVRESLKWHINNLFVKRGYPDTIALGISYISSALKQQGNTTELLYYTRAISISNLIKRIEKQPQLFAASITYILDYLLVCPLLKELKKRYPKVKIILGGAYPTLSAEEVIKNNDVDAVCIGEGEIAIPEYVKQVEADKFEKTNNLWIKLQNGVILKGDKNVFIEDITKLPHPDRKMWNRWINFGKEHKLLQGRGCKYQCMYCANRSFAKISEGKYLRHREIPDIMSEIKDIQKDYPDVQSIYLEEDNSLSDVNFMTQLCNAFIEYNKTLKKPLSFSMKLNCTGVILREYRYLIDLFKKANITMVLFGLESGSLEIRKKLHRPYYTNEEMIEFCKVLRENNISILMFVMYCYPFETKKTYLETIDCLAKCKPNNITVSWLLPLEGTVFSSIYDSLPKKKFLLKEKFYLETLQLRVFYKIHGIKLILHIFPFDYIIQKISEFNAKRRQKQMQENNKNINLAKQELDKGNYKQAVNYFNKVKIREDNYWVYGDRAIAKMEIKDYDGAIKDFDKVLSLDPKEIYKQKRQEVIQLKGY